MCAFKFIRYRFKLHVGHNENVIRLWATLRRNWIITFKNIISIDLCTFSKLQKSVNSGLESPFCVTKTKAGFSFDIQKAYANTFAIN